MGVGRRTAVGLIVAAAVLGGCLAPEPAAPFKPLQPVAALALDTTSVEAREVLNIIERTLPEFSTGVVLAEPLEGSEVHVITVPGTFDEVEVDMGFDSTWVSAFSRFGERIQDQMRERAVRSLPTLIRRCIDPVRPDGRALARPATEPARPLGPGGRLARRAQSRFESGNTTTKSIIKAGICGARGVAGWFPPAE